VTGFTGKSADDADYSAKQAHVELAMRMRCVRCLPLTCTAGYSSFLVKCAELCLEYARPARVLRWFLLAIHVAWCVRAARVLVPFHHSCTQEGTSCALVQFGLHLPVLLFCDCALCRKRDPGSAPNVGDRVAYVIIQAAKVCGWLSACACTLLRADVLGVGGCFDGGVVSVAQWLVCVGLQKWWVWSRCAFSLPF
jgi:hypothetical protein